MTKPGIQVLKERRKSRRVKTTVFISFQPTGSNKLFQAITNNIGKSGLMYCSSCFMPQGSKLTFELYQPLDSKKHTLFSIFANGQVIWIRKIAKTNEYMVGIQITKIAGESQDRISSYINKR